MTWHPGMTDGENLQGTTRTLDGARGGKTRGDTAKGILGVAWPLLFIAVMGLLLKFTDFAAVLLIAAVITGLIWLFDAKWSRKRQATAPSSPPKSPCSALRRGYRRGDVAEF